MTQHTKRPLNITVAGATKKIAYDYEPALSQAKMLALYQTVKSALPGKACPVLQFASAYAGEGANLIAFEAAFAVATQVGLRVLYLDTAHYKPKRKPELAEEVSTTLDSLLQSGGSLEQALVGIEQTSFTYTLLRHAQLKDSALANLDQLQELVTLLRSHYDLIVIPSAHMLEDVLSASLSRLADGAILVVEAERTRAPVVLQLKEAVQHGGGKIIGSILNKRRYYIPHWVYRWL